MVSRRKGKQLLMRVTIMPVHLNHKKKHRRKVWSASGMYSHIASRISHGSGRKIYLINSSVRILQNFSFVVQYIDDKYRRMKKYCTLTFPMRFFMSIIQKNFCKAGTQPLLNACYHPYQFDWTTFSLVKKYSTVHRRKVWSASSTRISHGCRRKTYLINSSVVNLMKVREDRKIIVL